MADLIIEFLDLAFYSYRLYSNLVRYCVRLFAFENNKNNISKTDERLYLLYSSDISYYLYSLIIKT